MFGAGKKSGIGIIYRKGWGKGVNVLNLKGYFFFFLVSFALSHVIIVSSDGCDAMHDFLEGLLGSLNDDNDADVFVRLPRIIP